MNPEEEEEQQEINFDSHEDTAVVFQVIIPRNKRIFSDYISLYEFTQVICSRVDMIKKRGPIYVEGENDTLAIAIKEIIERRCPLTIIRERGVEGNTRYVEYWPVNELRIPPKCFDEYKIAFRDHDTNAIEDIHKLLDIQN